MNEALLRAAELATAYLDSLAEAPISQEPDVAALREGLMHELGDEGVPATRVIEELARDVDPGLLRTGSGRFHGWVIGGTLPVAIAADWLTATWDQNAAAHACSPAAAVVEEIAAGWVKDLLGLPASASFAFVTGCQMAHVTSLAAARHHLLDARGWDVRERGLSGAPPIRVLVGEHHETLLRALRLLGIGTNAVERVAQSEDGPLDVGDLERVLARDPGAPTIVALAAGDLNRGAFDPFAEACERAHARGAWVHVDGAFGLWAAASPRFRHLVRGVEQADSWATDAHKWLNVPHDCGLALVAHPASHRAAMSIPVSYRVDVEGVRDQFEWGPDWSRRARGFATYAALRALGRRGVAELVERCCDRARDLVRGLGELPGVEVLSAPVINQGLVRFTDPDGDHDARTEAVIRRIARSGAAWFGPATWRGMRVMRISVSSWRTSAGDVERTVAAVAAALGSSGDDGP
jgi:glutamate/tyrosine decarboxylase-like PLP-dependent enzyme